MRSSLYRLVIIGVSAEQRPRGRLLKPRHKSEKNRQNRRAGKLGSGSAGTIRAAARDCPIMDLQDRARQRVAPGRGRGWVEGQSFAAGRPMTPQRRQRSFPPSPRNGEFDPQATFGCGVGAELKTSTPDTTLNRHAPDRPLGVEHGARGLAGHGGFCLTLRAAATRPSTRSIPEAPHR